MTFFEAIMIFISGGVFGYLISALMILQKEGDERESKSRNANNNIRR